ncbi:MAG: HAMP domain-containing sensor histidine kinase [Clostridium sp.]
MKIKSWVRSIHMVMVFTVLITSISCLYILMEQKHIKEELISGNIKDKLTVYDKVLSDGRIYKEDYDFKSLLVEEDIEVDVYLPSGICIYSSSTNNNEILGLNISNRLKDLYNIRFEDGKPTITKIALLNGKLAGIYKLTLTSSKDSLFYMSDFNIACIMLVITTLISLLIISRIINNKMTKPISKLQGAINGFAKGECVEIRIDGNNEISMLSKVFNNMREEIIHKNKVIDEEKKAREYMVATISHDLKSPLTSIRVYSELLSTSEDDSSKYTRVIMDKCDYMNVMIEDLLTYSVLTSESKMEFVSVEGEEFFSTIFDGFDSLCNSKNRLYESSILCSGEYDVNVKEITRVVDNLTSNAIKYTNEGNKIWSGVYSSDYGLPQWVDYEFIEDIKALQEDGLVVIVKNQGEYINSEKRKCIFEPFYKCEGGESTKGTGLGLSIVKLIVDKHNGQVKLYSKKDSGNIFVFSLKKQK